MNRLRRYPRRMGLAAVVAVVGSLSLTLCTAADLTSKRTLTLPGQGGEIMSLAFSPDGKSLACGGGKIPGELFLWDLAKGKPKFLSGHKKRVVKTAFSPDGKTLLSSDDAGIVKSWEVRTGKDLGIFCRPGGSAFGLAFSPDGKTVATSVGNGITLWDAQTGKQIMPFAGGPGILYALAWAPDSKTIATGNTEIRLFDAETGKEKKVLKGHESLVRSIAFHPDGELLVSGGHDKSVRVWDITAGKEKANLQGHTNTLTCVAISPDGMDRVRWTRQGRQGVGPGKRRPQALTEGAFATPGECRLWA